jgi:hypothetical protein
MSAASTLTKSIGERSIVLRALRTPLSNLLRGKITGRVKTIQAMVNEAALPVPLDTIVRDVIKRSRLWRSEKLDVAMELIAHFADGLESGQSPEQLAESFGDLAQAAVLIRKAKKRNRPLSWRVARGALRGMALFIVIIIGVYIMMLARFYMGAPAKPVDYRPQLNKAALALKEDERAWPIYRQAALQLPKLPEAGFDVAKRNRLPMPGEPGWESLAEYLRANQAAIAIARTAIDKPGLGFVAGYEFSPEDQQLWPNTKFTDYDIERYGLMSVLLPYFTPLRTLSKVLTLDAQQAAFSGDGATAMADIEAALVLSSHMRETPLIISNLVSLAIFQQALHSLDLILAYWPESLSDQQLQAMAHTIAAHTDEQLVLQLSAERLGFQDIVQRVYTDDGNGDGRLTPQGFRMLDFFVAWDFNGRNDPQTSKYLMLAGPAVNAVMLGRRDMLNEYHQMMDMAEVESRLPLWQRGSSAFETKLEGWASSPFDTARRMPLVLLMPALGKASRTSQFAIAARDATTTAIALELYRRKHGAWPATLSELVPLIPSVPRDRYDGAAMRYSLIDGKPVLYSVGVDRDDDGGLPPMPNGIPNTESAKQWKTLEQVAAIKAMQSQNPRWSGIALADGDWVLWPPVIGPLE